MIISLEEVWRDKPLLDEMRSEIKRQSLQNWKVWEILLPPELLWPMLEEVSQGMYQQWSPSLFGAGVQVGEEKEVAIKFVLPDLKMSPVMVKSMPYLPNRTSNIVPVKVNTNGHKI